MRALWRFLFAVLFLARCSPAQQPVRIADGGCRQCHQAIYDKYVATPMANASGQASEQLRPGAFTHPGSGIHYTISKEGGDAYLDYADPRDRRIAGRRRLDYFLGSGHLGTTYLYTQEGFLLESPVAWYAATGSYDLKPGYEGVHQLPAAIPMEAGCLRCHMSGVASPQPGTSNRYTGLAFQQTGITCESCHGDTAAHVRTQGKAPVINPAKLDPERRDAVCISCHLEGDVKVERASHSALAYRPGDRIADFLSYFVFASGDPLSRGVSEVEQFQSSKCRRVSGDGMSCVNCHDPHGSPAPAQRVAFYRAKCLTCHSAPAFASTHHPENPDCTGCHMPRSTAQNIPHVAWTDHRILRTPSAATAPMDTNKARPLKAIFSPEADERDLAMATYNVALNGNPLLRREALSRLEAAYASGARDTDLIEALGALSAMQGEAERAKVHLTELLRLDPLNFTALSNLGVYAARQGDLKSTLARWKPVFERNEDQIAFARNLAVVQCADGDEPGAKSTMRRALAFSPGLTADWDFTCPNSQPTLRSLP